MEIDAFQGVQFSQIALNQCNVSYADTAVTVGTENSRIELKNSAMFSTRYSIGGNPSGLLAAISPLRTDYARMIAILEGIAQCAGEMIEELISA